MKIIPKLKSKFAVSSLLSLGASTLVASCAPIPSQELQSIKIDGSSTVYPITEAMVREYQESPQEQVEVTVNFSGTSGGFKKFCAGETDINDASRPIKTEEMKACAEAGVRYVELPIAFDALTVVINKNNDWVKSLTVEELKKYGNPQQKEKLRAGIKFVPTSPIARLIFLERELIREPSIILPKPSSAKVGAVAPITSRAKTMIFWCKESVKIPMR